MMMMMMTSSPAHLLILLLLLSACCTTKHFATATADTIVACANDQPGGTFDWPPLALAPTSSPATYSAVIDACTIGTLRLFENTDALYKPGSIDLNLWKTATSPETRYPFKLTVKNSLIRSVVISPNAGDEDTYKKRIANTLLVFNNNRLGQFASRVPGLVFWNSRVVFEQNDFQEEHQLPSVRNSSSSTSNFGNARLFYLGIDDSILRTYDNAAERNLHGWNSTWKPLLTAGSSLLLHKNTFNTTLFGAGDITIDTKYEVCGDARSQHLCVAVEENSAFTRSATSAIVVHLSSALLPAPSTEGDSAAAAAADVRLAETLYDVSAAGFSVSGNRVVAGLLHGKNNAYDYPVKHGCEQHPPCLGTGPAAIAMHWWTIRNVQIISLDHNIVTTWTTSIADSADVDTVCIALLPNVEDVKDRRVENVGLVSVSDNDIVHANSTADHAARIPEWLAASARLTNGRDTRGIAMWELSHLREMYSPIYDIAETRINRNKIHVALVVSPPADLLVADPGLQVFDITGIMLAQYSCNDNHTIIDVSSNTIELFGDFLGTPPEEVARGRSKQLLHGDAFGINFAAFRLSRVSTFRIGENHISGSYMGVWFYGIRFEDPDPTTYMRFCKHFPEITYTDSRGRQKPDHGKWRQLVPYMREFFLVNTNLVQVDRNVFHLTGYAAVIGMYVNCAAKDRCGNIDRFTISNNSFSVINTFLFSNPPYSVSGKALAPQCIGVSVYFSPFASGHLVISNNVVSALARGGLTSAGGAILIMFFFPTGEAGIDTITIENNTVSFLGGAVDLWQQVRGISISLTISTTVPFRFLRIRNNHVQQLQILPGRTSGGNGVFAIGITVTGLRTSGIEQILVEENRGLIDASEAAESGPVGGFVFQVVPSPMPQREDGDQPSSDLADVVAEMLGLKDISATGGWPPPPYFTVDDPDVPILYGPLEIVVRDNNFTVRAKNAGCGTLFAVSGTVGMDVLKYSAAGNGSSSSSFQTTSTTLAQQAEAPMRRARDGTEQLELQFPPALFSPLSEIIEVDTREDDTRPLFNGIDVKILDNNFVLQNAEASQTNAAFVFAPVMNELTVTPPVGTLPKQFAGQISVLTYFAAQRKTQVHFESLEIRGGSVVNIVTGDDGERSAPAPLSSLVLFSGNWSFVGVTVADLRVRVKLAGGVPVAPPLPRHMGSLWTPKHVFAQQWTNRFLILSSTLYSESTDTDLVRGSRLFIYGALSIAGVEVNIESNTGAEVVGVFLSQHSFASMIFISHSKIKLSSTSAAAVGEGQQEQQQQFSLSPSALVVGHGAVDSLLLVSSSINISAAAATETSGDSGGSRYREGFGDSAALVVGNFQSGAADGTTEVCRARRAGAIELGLSKNRAKWKAAIGNITQEIVSRSAGRHWRTEQMTKTNVEDAVSAFGRRWEAAAAVAATVGTTEEGNQQQQDESTLRLAIIDVNATLELQPSRASLSDQPPAKTSDGVAAFSAWNLGAIRTRMKMLNLCLLQSTIDVIFTGNKWKIGDKIGFPIISLNPSAELLQSCGSTGQNNGAAGANTAAASPFITIENSRFNLFLGDPRETTASSSSPTFLPRGTLVVSNPTQVPPLPLPVCPSPGTPWDSSFSAPAPAPKAIATKPRDLPGGGAQDSGLTIQLRCALFNGADVSASSYFLPISLGGSGDSEVIQCQPSPTRTLSMSRSHVPRCVFGFQIEAGTLSSKQYDAYEVSGKTVDVNFVLLLPSELRRAMTPPPARQRTVLETAPPAGAQQSEQRTSFVEQPRRAILTDNNASFSASTQLLQSPWLQVVSLTPEVGRVVKVRVGAARSLVATVSFSAGLGYTESHLLRLAVSPELLACQFVAKRKSSDDEGDDTEATATAAAAASELDREELLSRPEMWPEARLVINPSRSTPGAVFSSINAAGSAAAIALTFLSANPLAMARMNSLNVLSDIARGGTTACVVSTNDPMTSTDSPLQMTLGNDEGRYLKGAVVGNFLLVFIVLVFMVLIAFVKYRRRLHARLRAARRWIKTSLSRSEVVAILRRKKVAGRLDDTVGVAALMDAAQRNEDLLAQGSPQWSLEQSAEVLKKVQAALLPSANQFPIDINLIKHDLYSVGLPSFLLVPLVGVANGSVSASVALIRQNISWAYGIFGLLYSCVPLAILIYEVRFRLPRRMEEQLEKMDEESQRAKMDRKRKKQQLDGSNSAENFALHLPLTTMRSRSGGGVGRRRSTVAAAYESDDNNKNHDDKNNGGKIIYVDYEEREKRKQHAAAATTKHNKSKASQQQQQNQVATSAAAERRRNIMANWFPHCAECTSEAQAQVEALRAAKRAAAEQGCNSETTSAARRDIRERHDKLKAGILRRLLQYATAAYGEWGTARPKEHAKAEQKKQQQQLSERAASWRGGGASAGAGAGSGGAGSFRRRRSAVVGFEELPHENNIDGGATTSAAAAERATMQQQQQQSGESISQNYVIKTAMAAGASESTVLSIANFFHTPQPRSGDLRYIDSMTAIFNDYSWRGRYNFVLECCVIYLVAVILGLADPDSCTGVAAVLSILSALPLVFILATGQPFRRRTLAIFATSSAVLLVVMSVITAMTLLREVPALEIVIGIVGSFMAATASVKLSLDLLELFFLVLRAEHLMLPMLMARHFCTHNTKDEIVQLSELEEKESKKNKKKEQQKQALAKEDRSKMDKNRSGAAAAASASEEERRSHSTSSSVAAVATSLQQRELEMQKELQRMGQRRAGGVASTRPRHGKPITFEEL